MRQVLLRNGQTAWVNDDGQIVKISNGMGGAEPGFGETPQSNLPPPNVYRPDARTRDLMSRLPAADIAGLRGPGVVPGGEIPVGMQRLLQNGASITPALPTHRPLAGAQQNNRGGTRIVVLDTFNGQPAQDISSIVETPRNGGDDAEVIGIHLGIDMPAELTDPTSGQAIVNFEVVGIIQWGTGGAIFSAEVDWGVGTSFSVNASWVRVSARISAVADFAQPATQITLKAALSYGKSVNVNTSSPLRRSILVGGPTSDFYLAPGETSNTYLIPDWAVGFTLLDVADGIGGYAAPNYAISLYQGVGTLSIIYTMVDRTNNANQVEGQYPIPSGTRFITVTNNLLTDAARPKLVFNLAF
jgi:hypothetical protein